MVIRNRTIGSICLHCRQHTFCRNISPKKSIFFLWRHLKGQTPHGIISAKQHPCLQTGVSNNSRGAVYNAEVNRQELHAFKRQLDEENTVLTESERKLHIFTQSIYKLVAMVTQKEPGLFSRACSGWLFAKLNRERMTTTIQWECKCGTEKSRVYCKENISLFLEKKRD